MPEGKWHDISVALIAESRITYALSAWGGFLNGQQKTGLMRSSRELDDMDCAVFHAYVLCLQLDKQFTVSLTEIFKVLFTAYCICFHLKRQCVVCSREVVVMFFLYVIINLYKNLILPSMSILFI